MVVYFWRFCFIERGVRAERLVIQDKTHNGVAARRTSRINAWDTRKGDEWNKRERRRVHVSEAISRKYLSA